MKTLLTVLVALLLVAGCSAPANADPIPEYTFDSETCVLTITPPANSLNEWNVVINTETNEIGLHHDSEGPWLTPFVVLPAAPEVYLGDWVECGTATPNDEVTWGTMKSLYR